MKKALILAALLATAGAAEANTAASAVMTELDTRTQGAAVLAAEARIDSRGLTFAESLHILLKTLKARATIIVVR